MSRKGQLDDAHAVVPKPDGPVRPEPMVAAGKLRGDGVQLGRGERATLEQVVERVPQAQLPRLALEVCGRRHTCSVSIARDLEGTR